MPTVLAFGKQQIVIRFNRLIPAPDRHPGQASINEDSPCYQGLSLAPWPAHQKAEPQHQEPSGLTRLFEYRVEPTEKEKRRQLS